MATKEEYEIALRDVVTLLEKAMETKYEEDIGAHAIRYKSPPATVRASWCEKAISRARKALKP